MRWNYEVDWAIVSNNGYNETGTSDFKYFSQITNAANKRNLRDFTIHAYARAYVAYTLYGRIEVWFQRGMQNTAEEIAEIFMAQGL